MAPDKRRYGVIECRRINSETYWLEINGQMWSEVEWSRSRRAWCIQDAAGQCLTHVEHIVGQDRDVQTAIRLAKRMIVDGRMPTPEEAHRQLEQRSERERLGEPLPVLDQRQREPEPRGRVGTTEKKRGAGKTDTASNDPRDYDPLYWIDITMKQLQAKGLAYDSQAAVTVAFDRLVYCEYSLNRFPTNLGAA